MSGKGRDKSLHYGCIAATGNEAGISPHPCCFQIPSWKPATTCSVERCYRASSSNLGASFEPRCAPRIARGQCRICGAPIPYAERTYAEGKKIIWRDGLQTLRWVFRHNLSD
jgi:hypothetical protein